MYYKLYFRDVSGELADMLEVTLTDGSNVLYTGTLSGLTRSTAAQQTCMSFVLCADAVQTKNNPTGLFD